jgi:cytochrome c-type biogenesis protein CcmF
VVTILTLRIDSWRARPAARRWCAREGAFFINNLLLVALMFTVLIGTLHPIFAESVRGIKVSVGAPYFNRMAIPLFLSLLLLVGVGPRCRGAPVIAAAAPRAAAAAAGGGRRGGARAGTRRAQRRRRHTCAFAGTRSGSPPIRALRPARQRVKKGDGVGAAARPRCCARRDRIGAYVVHFGVIVVFVAVAVSSASRASAKRGSVRAIRSRSRATRSARRHPPASSAAPLSNSAPTIAVTRGGRDLGTSTPALNQYPTQMDPIATPAVRTSLTHDLYLTLMSVDANGGIGLRAIVTPAVVWIWIGVFVMVAGTVLCLHAPRRAAEASRRAKRAVAPAQATA